MTTSASGRGFIKGWETFRDRVYPDLRGLPTVAWGHRVKPNERFDETVTPERGELILESDLGVAESLINAWVVRVTTLEQHEFDAVVSFVYNLGGRAFLGSTLLRLLKTGQRHAAEGEFEKWDHCDGKVVPGLLRRRTYEKIMFATGEYRKP